MTQLDMCHTMVNAAFCTADGLKKNQKNQHSAFYPCGKLQVCILVIGIQPGLVCISQLVIRVVLFGFEI